MDSSIGKKNKRSWKKSNKGQNHVPRFLFLRLKKLGLTAKEIRERVLADRKRKIVISKAISTLVTLDEARNSSSTATTKPLFRAVEFDSFGNSKSMTLSKGSLGVS